MSSSYNAYQYIVKVAGIKDMAKGAWGGIKGQVANSFSDLDPRTPPPDDTLAYSLVKGITRFFSPRIYDEEGAGPYEEFSKYMKDTETGDLLLREAAKLRQKARILLKQQEEEEKNKQHAARSRYF